MINKIIEIIHESHNYDYCNYVDIEVMTVKDIRSINKHLTCINQDKEVRLNRLSREIVEFDGDELAIRYSIEDWYETDGAVKSSFYLIFMEDFTIIADIAKIYGLKVERSLKAEMWYRKYLKENNNDDMSEV